MGCWNYWCAMVISSAALIVSLSVCSVQAVTLFGEVKHADNLPDQTKALVKPNAQHLVPLIPQGDASKSSTLKGGAASGVLQGATKLTSTTPSLEQPKVEWFLVPDWMAGKWTKKGDITINYTDLETGRMSQTNQFVPNLMTVTWGHQRDRLGHTWHANFIPSERDSVSGDELVRFVTLSQCCEETSDARLMTRTHYIVTELHEQQKVVTKVFQQEALNCYLQAGTDQMDDHSSNRIFTLQGRPTSSALLVSHFVRSEPYCPTQVINGVNMVQSLNSYLRTHGMDDLMVPVSAP